MNKHAKRVTCRLLRNNALYVCRKYVASGCDRTYLMYFLSSTFPG